MNPQEKFDDTKEVIRHKNHTVVKKNRTLFLPGNRT
jgi:hypothetical protein